MARKILVIGVTSAIAAETAKHYAERGDDLFLVARNASRLALIADDFRKRGAGKVGTMVLDVVDYAQHADMLNRANAQLGGIDIALIAHGTLPNQKACEASFEETRRELEINLMSVLSLLTMLGNFFEQQKRGTLAVFTSVAGDRGRQSNYVYGMAKGAVGIFLQGMRNRLQSSGVTVITLKIGRVDTPMTVDFEKSFLWAKPAAVGKAIFQVIDRGKEIAYVPWYWWGVMLGIKAIPEQVFKKLGM